MAAAVTSSEIDPTDSHHVAVRLVQPGSCVHCLHCHDTIEFVPGGAREQVTCKVYCNGELQYVEVFHPSCYAAADLPHGEPS